MIPEGAEALQNDAGIAPGFFIELQGQRIWVLPGPPKEIAAIWSSHVNDRLETVEKEMNLKIWQCAGVPESELAFMTEDFFSKYDFKKKFGYRFQPGRVVEVKLWFEKNCPEADTAVAAFENVIGRFRKT
jgi:molybdopterin-biosynthesis enzyme MoeA-like protein